MNSNKMCIKYKKVGDGFQWNAGCGYEYRLLIVLCHDKNPGISRPYLSPKMHDFLYLIKHPTHDQTWVLWEIFSIMSIFYQYQMITNHWYMDLHTSLDVVLFVIFFRRI